MYYYYYCYYYIVLFHLLSRNIHFVYVIPADYNIKYHTVAVSVVIGLHKNIRI
jgi:hypothetical protein